MISQIKLFCKCNAPLFCYGTGEYAFWISIFLYLIGREIDSYIVTKKTESMDVYLKRPVYEISAVSKKQLLKKCIIVAVSEKYHREIRESLIPFSISAFYISDIEINEIKSHIYVLLKKGEISLHDLSIFTTEEINRIYGFLENEEKNKIYKIYNPFKSSSLMELFYLKNKYNNYPRYTMNTVAALNQNWIVPDMASFLSQYDEIIVNKIYEFRPRESNNIQILDFGANIGLSVYFFATMYPTAIIDAYEPDSRIFSYLKNNISKQVHSTRIKLHNQAVWDKECSLTFFSEGADGGHVSDRLNGSNVTVLAVDAVGILEQYDRIDFLKIDIEGAETRVLKRIVSQLYKVDNIFVEYHSFYGESQTISVVVDILSSAGFKLYFDAVMLSKNPFLRVENSNGFDAQVNIFGVKMDNK